MGERPTIVLHQPARGPRAPSFSPFAVKLETFLRMAKIDYKNCHGLKTSPKGKIPWITFNGEVLSDTQFIIEHLNHKLNINLNKELNPDQKAVAHAFRKMAEENLFWCLVLSRLQMVSWVVKILKAPKLLGWVLARKFRNQAKAQGMGRHSLDEMLHIMEGDLEALSVYLGDKKFFFGDKPCETDAALFGQLSQIYWHIPDSPGERLVREKFKNLAAYCERMKDTYWPDWDECNTKEGTVHAPK